MSHLVQKSVINFNAAEILGTPPNNHYCSAIHCSYYSCYQKARHVLFFDLGYDNDRLAREVRQNTMRLGSHDYLIKIVYEVLIETNVDNARDFKNKINELKSMRVVSDYNNESIGLDLYGHAMRLAESIIKVLNRTFHL